MKKDSEKRLKELLCKSFCGHGQRMTLLSKLILSMIQLCTVNYSKLALSLNGSVKVSSNFKRIQRFMRFYAFNRSDYLDFVWSQYGQKGQWIILSMDRTNWKFGQLNINILTVGISWRGTAIPLVWKLLIKRGNSNVQERIDLMAELLKKLDAQQRSKLRYILMDREFACEEWISWLKQKQLSFVIRIRTDARVRKLGEHKTVAAKSLFQCPQLRVLKKHRVVFKHRLFLAGHKIKGNEYLILISDQRLKHGQVLYGERWGIEVFFASLKTRGFCFEDTHLVHHERIETLMYVLSIAFIWTFKMGEWLLKNGFDVPRKKLRDKIVKLKSIFRIGLDHLRNRILNFLDLQDEIKLLSCT